MEPIKYMTSILTFYLKGEIAADQNFVKFKTPNTILGLIPLGAKKESVPVTQIASTQSNFKLKFGKLLLGIIAAFLAISTMTADGGFFGGLIILIFAANWILDAFELDLQVNMTSGKTKLIDFFIFEKAKAVSAENQINAIVANRLDDTNTRQQTDRIVDAINSK